MRLFLADKWKICRAIIFVMLFLPALQCSKDHKIESKKQPAPEEQLKPVPEPVVQIEQKGKGRARLAKKGMCAAYTITLVNGDLDRRLVDSVWTNPFTNQKYLSAFGVENFCDFDYGINEGDEFNFEVVATGNKGCPNCAAAYPYPPKRLNIKVLEVFRKS